MVSLDWCLCQKNGIDLISPKKHLFESYLEQSFEDFSNSKSSKSEDWKLISSYYSCYHAFYAILMRCGIKCEIHDCTIELMKLFDFSDDDIMFMIDLKKKRVKVQYYLKKEIVDIEKVKTFIVKCRKILEDLNANDINEIRGKLR